MSHTIEKVTSAAVLGESPYWCGETQSLYYVDIKGHAIHHYIPSTKENFSIQRSEVVSFIIPVAGQPGKFITTSKNKIVLLSWDGKSCDVQSEEVIAIADPEPENKDNRINDGKADPKGRLWAGTLVDNENIMTNKGHGSLFSLTDGRTILNQAPVSLSNGLGWSVDGKVMYYIDSLEGTVDSFDYNLEYGLITNRQVVFDLAKNGIKKGLLDGMTVDADGNLWVAVYLGGVLLQIDPANGKLIKSVAIPAEQVTCAVFGGPNLDELYVTTAKNGLSEAQIKACPDAGCVFRIKGLGVKGLPCVPVKLP